MLKKLDINNYHEHILIEEPCSPALAGQGIFDCKEFCQFVDSLANPAVRQSARALWRTGGRGMRSLLQFKQRKLHVFKTFFSLHPDTGC